MFIKAKCDAGRLVVGLMLDPAEDRAEQMSHYKNVRNECMAHVEKIQYEFHRGSPSTTSLRCALLLAICPLLEHSL